MAEDARRIRMSLELASASCKPLYSLLGDSSQVPECESQSSPEPQIQSFFWQSGKRATEKLWGCPNGWLVPEPGFRLRNPLPREKGYCRSDMPRGIWRQSLFVLFWVDVSQTIRSKGTAQHLFELTALRAMLTDFLKSLRMYLQTCRD